MGVPGRFRAAQSFDNDAAAVANSVGEVGNALRTARDQLAPPRSSVTCRERNGSFAFEHQGDAETVSRSRTDGLARMFTWAPARPKGVSVWARRCSVLRNSTRSRISSRLLHGFRLKCKFYRCQGLFAMLNPPRGSLMLLAVRPSAPGAPIGIGSALVKSLPARAPGSNAATSVVDRRAVGIEQITTDCAQANTRSAICAKASDPLDFVINRRIRSPPPSFLRFARTMPGNGN